jgi:hypothetical protein
MRRITQEETDQKVAHIKNVIAFKKSTHDILINVIPTELIREVLGYVDFTQKHKGVCDDNGGFKIVWYSD